MVNNLLNFYHNLEKKYKVVFWIALVNILVIITVVIIFFIYRLNNEPVHINITNWDEITSSDSSTIPKNFQKATKNEVYAVLTRFNKISSDIYADASIRPNTYYATKPNNNNIRVSFILDIDSLEHSFEIKFSYNDKIKNHNGELQITVACPHSSDIKYTKTKCYSSNNPFNEVVKYLPYTNKLPNSKAKITINKQTYSKGREHSGKQYLALSVNSCDNPDIIQEAKEYIPKWLKERYLDPNDFYYEVFNTCSI